MPLWISYTVACGTCGDWVVEADSRAEAKEAAREAGFVRRREDGSMDWVCPSDRSDVCGDKFSPSASNSEWCLFKPGHDGDHQWMRR